MMAPFSGLAPLAEISERFGTSMIYISHNLGLILETCDRITVMYSGEAIEVGDVVDVFNDMHHPYTRGLFGSIPLPGADKNSRPLVAIPGNFRCQCNAGKKLFALLHQDRRICVFTLGGSISVYIRWHLPAIGIDQFTPLLGA